MTGLGGDLISGSNVAFYVPK